MKKHQKFTLPRTAAPLRPPQTTVLSIPVFGFRASGFLLLLSFFATCGCTVLSYTGANGERFSRTSVGANTSIASLAVEAGTNGVRRVELQGYRSDSNQALTTVTEAAVRAALQAR